MKAKGVVITVLLCAGAVVGIGYGAGKVAKGSKTPVEVIAVPSVNSGSMDFSMSDQIGTIVSEDTQSVALDTSHELKKVYVKTGDSVRKGDSLLTYDMEADKLKREAEDLTKQGLQISLANMQKDLETMKSGRLPAGYGSTDEDPFYSAEAAVNSLSDGADASDAEVSGEGSDLTMSGDPASGKGSAGLAGERTEKTAVSLIDDTQDEEGSGASDSLSGDISLIDDSGDDSVDGGESSGGTSGDSGSDDGSGDADPGLSDGQDENQITDDPSGGLIDDSANTSGDDNQISEDVPVEPTQEDLGYVTDFMNAVNSLTDIASSGWENLSSDEAKALSDRAFDLFRTWLSTGSQMQTNDLFGQERMVYTYYVSDDAVSKFGEATASVLQTAYDRLCVYQFISSVLQIDPGRRAASSSYSSDEVQALSDRIHAAVDALYQLQSAVCAYDAQGNIVFSAEYQALNDPDSFSGEDYPQHLLGLVGLLNSSTLIVPEPETGFETETEFPDIPSDFGGDSTDTSATDLASAIKDQQKNIIECQLQIREADLALKEYDRTLEGETVKAVMDGVVMQAGTLTTQPESGGFIVLTGKKGLYVKSAISERSLASIQVGDTLTGTSWDTGASFTAEITEISQYPSDSTDNYNLYGTADQSASQYPFLAYIAEADGLTEGAYVQISLDTSGTAAAGGGLILEPYFVRTDENGKTYCLVRGDDGLLEKRYVRTEDTDYGSLKILSGLRATDYIAFPYGNDVKEGARTTEVESLSALNY